jgi:integrase
MGIEAPSTVNELCDRFLDHARTWYRQLPDRHGNRAPTGHDRNLASALRFARDVLGERDPAALTAEDLYAVQDWLLQQKRPDGTHLTRQYIDRVIKIARQCFRWAAKPPRRWVPTEVLVELSLVDRLVYGRTDAREPEEVQPVPHDHFQATITKLAEIGEDPGRSFWALRLATMLDLHYATGMRPGELVNMHRDDLCIERTPATLIDAPAEVMVYRPLQHKCRHHRMIRHIFLGPEGRRIVEDWLPRALPDGRFWAYTVNGYRGAVRRVQSQYKLPVFTPAQIRHAFATRIREASGLDVVQVLLGHKHRTTSEIYAQPSQLAAIAALLRYG